MSEISHLKKINILKNIAFFGLLLIASSLFIISLLSGSRDYGNGIIAIIKNSPNALPWFVLLLLILIAWKKQLIGGVLIFIFGLLLVYFFNFNGPNFWWFTFIMTSIIPFLGFLFLIAWYLKQRIK